VNVTQTEDLPASRVAAQSGGYETCGYRVSFWRGVFCYRSYIFTADWAFCPFGDNFTASLAELKLNHFIPR